MDIRGGARTNETGKKRKGFKKRRDKESGRDDNRFVGIRHRYIAESASISKEEEGKTESSERAGMSRAGIENGREKTAEANPRRQKVIEKSKTRAKKKGKTKRKGHGTLKAVFWNIAGITEEKEDIWKYLKNFEVIGLTETWMSDNQETRVQKILKEYKVKIVKAWREKKKGRLKGGILLAVKKQAVKKID